MTASHYIVYDPERTFFLDLRNQLLENIMKDRICAFLKVGPVPAYKRYLQNDLWSPLFGNYDSKIWAAWCSPDSACRIVAGQGWMKSKSLQSRELVCSICIYNYARHVLTWVEKAWQFKEITTADGKIVKNEDSSKGKCNNGDSWHSRIRC